MEVDEKQLNLFGESVLQLHDKIFEMIGLMNEQVAANKQLAEVVSKLNENVTYLMNEKYNNESERYRLQQRVDSIENDVYMKTQYSGRSHEKVNDVVLQMKQQMDRFNDPRIATTLLTMMEIFRLHLTQLDHHDRAEIVSKMASNSSPSVMAYELGFVYNPSEMLRLATTLLDQPESIITLYR